MKAGIDRNGRLIVRAENDLESFVLSNWSKEFDWEKIRGNKSLLVIYDSINSVVGDNVRRK